MTRESTDRRCPRQQTAKSGSPITSRHRTTAGKALWGGISLGAAATVALATALWPQHSGPTPPRPVSTVSQNQRACLLSDHGQPASSSVFADLQRAATTHGHVNVQQLALTAQATDAAPDLAALIQQHCAVIFTLGPLSTIAARAAAANKQRSDRAMLIAVTDDIIMGGGLVTLPLTGLTPDQISKHLDDALTATR